MREKIGNMFDYIIIALITPFALLGRFLFPKGSKSGENFLSLTFLLLCGPIILFKLLFFTKREEQSLEEINEEGYDYFNCC